MTAEPPAVDATRDHETTDNRPIGVFDSGIGGLSVIRHLRQQLPHEDLLYFADQTHIPYGARPVTQIQDFSCEITRFLLDHDAKLIVVACNTATAAAIETLRTTFPDTLFVGMEPALKPAAAQTTTGKIGVLATPGTFASTRYATLVDRFARQVTVYEDPCVGLVEEIEAGRLTSNEAHRILTAATGPMLAAGVDTLVLGCTHYPFVLPLLTSIVGEDVTVIDPAPAVARRTAYVLQQHLPSGGQLSCSSDRHGKLTVYTSGDSALCAQLTSRLLEGEYEATHIEWVDGELVADKSISH